MDRAFMYTLFYIKHWTPNPCTARVAYGFPRIHRRNQFPLAASTHSSLARDMQVSASINAFCKSSVHRKISTKNDLRKPIEVGKSGFQELNGIHSNFDMNFWVLEILQIISNTVSEITAGFRNPGFRNLVISNPGMGTY